MAGCGRHIGRFDRQLIGGTEWWGEKGKVRRQHLKAGRTVKIGFQIALESPINRGKEGLNCLIGESCRGEVRGKLAILRRGAQGGSQARRLQYLREQGKCTD